MSSPLKDVVDDSKVNLSKSGFGPGLLVVCLSSCTLKSRLSQCGGRLLPFREDSVPLSLGMRSGGEGAGQLCRESSPRAEKHGGRGAELRPGSRTPRLASGREGPRPSGRH